jgi:hypothetical protein
MRWIATGFMLVIIITLSFTETAQYKGYIIIFQIWKKRTVTSQNETVHFWGIRGLNGLILSHPLVAWHSKWRRGRTHRSGGMGSGRGHAELGVTTRGPDRIARRASWRLQTTLARCHLWVIIRNLAKGSSCRLQTARFKSECWRNRLAFPPVKGTWKHGPLDI